MCAGPLALPRADLLLSARPAWNYPGRAPLGCAWARGRPVVPDTTSGRRGIIATCPAGGAPEPGWRLELRVQGRRFAPLIQRRLHELARRTSLIDIQRLATTNGDCLCEEAHFMCVEKKVDPHFEPEAGRRQIQAPLLHSTSTSSQLSPPISCLGRLMNETALERN